MLPLYDAHNHLQDSWLEPHRRTVVDDLTAIGLKGAVVNGTSESDWADVAALADSFPWIVPSYGLHPWDAGNRSPGWQTALIARLAANPTAAVGEIGLDRWMLDRARPDDPRLAGLRRAPLDEQTEVLIWQLTLAARQNRAATIHCLDAFGALLACLQRSPLPARGFLLHAYAGPAEMVPTFADLGAHFSFNGSFLEPRRQSRLEAFRLIPADRLLVETDAPAMRLPTGRERFAPLPTPDGPLANHPANLAATYQALAALRGIPVETLATHCAENFLRLFDPPAARA